MIYTNNAIHQMMLYMKYKEKVMLPDNMNIITVKEDGRNYHRYLYKNGEQVSSLIVIDLTTRLGETGLRTASIGNVSTPEKHQGNGYMRILMEDTCEYIKNENYDISLLIGIPHFYHKFGYVVSMPLYKQKLDHDFIHKVDVNLNDHSVKEMCSDDYHDIITLFNRNNSACPGSVVRYDDYFKGFTRGSEFEAVPETTVIRNGAGELVAYFVSDKSDSELIVDEIECVDSSYFYRVLNLLHKIGAGRTVDDVDFILPPDHPFVKFIRRFGYTVQTEFPQNGMMMSKICNLESLFKNMLPELEKRVQMRLGQYNRSLAIETEIGTVTLSCEKGSLNLTDELVEDRFVVSASMLVQLMTGYRELDDLLISVDGEVRCDNHELASILHPGREPFLWTTDYF